MSGLELPAARLRMVIGRLGRRLGSSGAAGGLTPSQLSVLGTVARRGPLRLSELAEREGINPTMLSRIVGKLDDDGWILRRVDEHDRRAVHVEVTASGRAEHDRIVARRTEVIAAGLRRLPAEECDSIIAALPALEHFVAELTGWQVPMTTAPSSSFPPGSEPGGPREMLR